MAINKDSLATLEFSINGLPYCNIAAHSSIDPSTLAYSIDGLVWYGYNGESAPVSGHIKSINGVAWEHVKSYNNVLQSHIKTAIGVEG